MLTEAVSFFVATSTFTLALYITLFIILFIGVRADSLGRNNTLKWGSIICLYVIYVVDNFSSISMSSTKAALFNKDFAINLIEYCAIGLVYSLIEARLILSKASRQFSEYVNAVSKTYNKSVTDSSSRLLTTLNKTYDFISVSYDLDTKETSTTINTSLLTDNVTAWTILWPVYLINTIIGRMLGEFFYKFATLIKKLFSNYVQYVFSSKIEK